MLVATATDKSNVARNVKIVEFLKFLEFLEKNDTAIQLGTCNSSDSGD